jgi:hypothetical protein
MPFSLRFTAFAGSNDLDVPGVWADTRIPPDGHQLRSLLMAMSPRNVLVAGTDTVAGTVAYRHLGDRANRVIVVGLDR